MTPTKLARPCRRNGCGSTTTSDNGYCEAHKTRPIDNYTREAIKFYASTAWRRLRVMHLNKFPLCIVCNSDAKVVDHIVPIRTGGKALDLSNLQSMCHICHNRKRQTEMGHV